MSVIEIFVPGQAAPAGSKRGFYIKKINKVIMTTASKKQKPWQESVRWAFKQQYDRMVPPRGPLRLVIKFSELRLDSHYGTGRNAGKLKQSAPQYPHKTRTGDLTKLIRAVEDALEGLAFVNDKQIVDTHATKVYGDTCGALVRIEKMEERLLI